MIKWLKSLVTSYKRVKELESEINAYAASNKPQATINKIGAIMEARVNLGHNAAPLLTVEALMCVLAR